MNKKAWIWFWVIIALILLVPFLWYSYNKLVKREESVKMAWAQVENQYQRRADLILNLAETVKAYATHEQETFQNVIEARSRATQIKIDSENLDSEALSQYSETQAELSQALGRLLAVVENYPDLKANENFIMLQGQLEGAENRIAFERKNYNESVRRYNTYQRRFPKNLVAKLFGFPKMAYFESKAGSDQVDEIKF